MKGEDRIHQLLFYKKNMLVLKHPPFISPPLAKVCLIDFVNPFLSRFSCQGRPLKLNQEKTESPEKYFRDHCFFSKKTQNRIIKNKKKILFSFLANFS